MIPDRDKSSTEDLPLRARQEVPSILVQGCITAAVIHRVMSAEPLPQTEATATTALLREAAPEATIPFRADLPRRLGLRLREAVLPLEAAHHPLSEVLLQEVLLHPEVLRAVEVADVGKMIYYRTIRCKKMKTTSKIS